MNKYQELFCDKILFNKSENLQNFGLLIILNKEYKIIYISPDTGYFSDFTNFTNRFIWEVFSSKNKDDFQKLLEGLKESEILDTIVQCKKTHTTYYASFCKTGSFIHLTLEVDSTPFEFEHFSFAQNFANLLNESQTLSDLFDRIVDEIQKITTYDRILLYKFLPDWTGRVLAEVTTNSFKSFKNFHFPSTDIPAKFRELYQKINYRYIPDVSAKFIDINIPEEVDLSLCSLRGVMPVHKEYLLNMEVKASISVPILVNGKLWGLIVCHNKTPKGLDFKYRNLLILLSSFCATAIFNKEQLITSRLIREKKDKSLQVLNKKSVDKHIIKSILNKEFLNLLDCQGMMFTFENKLHSKGYIPNNDELLKLKEWFDDKNLTDISYWENFSEIYQSQVLINKAAGVLFIPVNPKKSEYILFFRPEKVKTLRWAGNPKEVLFYSENKKKYFPRKSFTEYSESIHGESENWEPHVIETAHFLKNHITEKILRYQTMKAEIAEKEVSQLSFIARKTDNLVFLIDNKAKIQYFNPSFGKFAGISFNQAKQKSLTDIFPGNEYFHQITNLIQSNLINKAFSQLISIDHKETIKHYNFHFTPLYTSNKNLEKIIAIGIDVSPIKTYSDKLAEKNQELNRFSYIVAHDLKAPLKTMKGVFTLIEDDLKELPSKHIVLMIDMIKKSIINMDEMISGILAYSKVGENPKKEKVNLPKLIEEVISILNPSTRFKIKTEVQNIELVTEKILLYQVISNLVSNALRYHDKDEDPWIKIHVIKNKKNLLISVSDNGPGIPKKQQKRIFEIFQTAHGTKREDSTGIGLAIVKKIIENKGCTIDVKSTLGKGTEFIFTWPTK
ncbi:MAG: ATP-binding protein [Cytophagaceae bacterium]